MRKHSVVIIYLGCRLPLVRPRFHLNRFCVGQVHRHRGWEQSRIAHLFKAIVRMYRAQGRQVTNTKSTTCALILGEGALYTDVSVSDLGPFDWFEHQSSFFLTTLFLRRFLQCTRHITRHVTRHVTRHATRHATRHVVAANVRRPKVNISANG